MRSTPDFGRSEILDLTWKQVDFNRRTITLYEQKNKSIDTLPVNQTALQVLKERYESTGGASLRVFLNECGKRIFAQNLIRSFHGAIKKAGIERLRFHDLRHTFATRLVQNGVDLYRVQKLGRWKTTSMIMRYAHHYPGEFATGDRDDGPRLPRKYHNFITATKKQRVTAAFASRNPLILFWLGDVDSNHDSRSQSPLSYH